MMILKRREDWGFRKALRNIIIKLVNNKVSIITIISVCSNVFELRMITFLPVPVTCFQSEIWNAYLDAYINDNSIDFLSVRIELRGFVEEKSIFPIEKNSHRSCQ